MLYYHREKFAAKPGALTELSQEVRLYAGSLAHERFISRQGLAVSQQSGANTVDFGAILCHPAAMDDAAGVDRFREYRRTLEEMLITAPIVEVSEVAGSEDNHYCMHDRWRSLRVEDPGYLEISPLVCNDCDGLVATYRPHLTNETASLLWYWEIQYRPIDSCWVLSAEYESWAAQELFDPASKLNELGTRAAAAIARETNCEVLYVLSTDGEVTHSCCPKCGGPFQNAHVRAYNALCPECCILTMQPDSTDL